MVFWIGGRLREVVAHDRWSHMEVRLSFIPSSYKMYKTVESVEQEKDNWGGQATTLAGTRTAKRQKF